MAQTSRSASAGRQRVIAVHGSASTGAQWSRLADLLSDRFEVSAPDLPGYGKLRNVALSGRPTLYGDAIKIASAAYQTATPVHLVAHSYGAAVAFAYALENPNDIASLTLIEPTLFHLLTTGRSEDMAYYSEISAVANAIRVDCLNGTPKRAMAHFVDYWNGAGTWQSMTPALQASLAAQTRQVARNFAAAFSEAWPTSICRRIQCPTLIVTAENSRGPAKRVAEIVAGAVPQARLECIADAGHMAPVTHPDVVNPLIAKFLAEVASDNIAASCRAAA